MWVNAVMLMLISLDFQALSFSHTYTLLLYGGSNVTLQHMYIHMRETAWKSRLDADKAWLIFQHNYHMRSLLMRWLLIEALFLHTSRKLS